MCARQAPRPRRHASVLPFLPFSDTRSPQLPSAVQVSISGLPSCCRVWNLVTSASCEVRSQAFRPALTGAAGLTRFSALTGHWPVAFWCRFQIARIIRTSRQRVLRQALRRGCLGCVYREGGSFVSRDLSASRIGTKLVVTVTFFKNSLFVKAVWGSQ